MVKVLFYGPLTDAIGRQIDLDIGDGCSIGELRQDLIRAYPRAMRQLLRSRAIVGSAAVADDWRAGADDQVEFLPPVSGG